MPREAVHGERIPTFDSNLPEEAMSAEDWEREQPVAEVRWHRWPESHVQVVTRLKGYEIYAEPGTPTCEYGMYVTLDRDGINRLIRNLRRARDQAFGRDE